MLPYTICNINSSYSKNHNNELSKIKNIEIPNGIKLINSLGFFDFTNLEKNAFCLITDSGTVPEESFYFKVPSITIRETTERPEFIEAGFNIISGLEPSDILHATSIITSMEINDNLFQNFENNQTSIKVLNIISGKFNRIKYLE